jgi:hypothetical protein
VGVCISFAHVGEAFYRVNLLPECNNGKSRRKIRLLSASEIVFVVSFCSSLVPARSIAVGGDVADSGTKLPLATTEARDATALSCLTKVWQQRKAVTPSIVLGGSRRFRISIRASFSHKSDKICDFGHKSSSRY